MFLGTYFRKISEPNKEIYFNLDLWKKKVYQRRVKWNKVEFAMPRLTNILS